VSKYEYYCNKCKNNFILDYPFGKAAKHPKCPECKHKINRVFLLNSIIFKGSGFYASTKRREQIEKNCDKVDKD